MKKVIIGLALIIVGCMTLILWRAWLIKIVLGIMPLLLISSGMIILSAGIRQIENVKIKNKTGIKSVKEKLSQKITEPKD